MLAQLSWLAAIGLAFSWGLPCESRAEGQEFRVDTEIYLGEQEEPVGHAVTLFEKAATYHFIDRPEQVIVFRQSASQPAGQFILLDVVKQRRTELPADRVTKLIKKLAEWSAKAGNDDLVRFAAAPDFTETFDEASGALTLSSPLWTYHVATIKPDDPSFLPRYREFSDLHAQLNALLYNNPAPGPRLALNQSLAERGLAPVEIRRTVQGEKEVVRAVHLFSWRLSRDDRARLDSAREMLAEYAKVDNETFRLEE
jgi:hypothetical protein